MKHPLLPDFVFSQAPFNRSKGHLTAVILLVDIKGYTTYTQRLMNKDRAGAEKVSLILNDFFSPQVELTYNSGGDILYFAGDSYTVLFDEHRSRNEIFEFAHALKKAIESSKDFKEAGLGVKISGEYGTVHWYLGENEHPSYFLYGDIFKRVSDSNSSLQAGEISLSDWPFQKDPDILKVSSKTYESSEKEIATILKKFLPEYDILQTTTGDFRDVVSFFLRFNFPDNEPQFEAIDACIEICRKHKLFIKELECGDKGMVLFGFLGAPVMHIHLKKRAIHLALECLRIIQEKFNCSIQVSLSSGRSFCGFIGGKLRHQYGIVGHSVNCAARYLAHCPDHAIITDRSMIIGNVEYNYLKSANLKGVQEPVELFLVDQIQKEQTKRTPLFGREKELAFVNDRLRSFSQHGEVKHVLISGNAGIGKSRLIQELKRLVKGDERLFYVSLYSNEIDYSAFLPLVNYLKGILDVNDRMNFALLSAKLFPILGDMQQIERRRITEIFSVLLNIDRKPGFFDDLDARSQFEMIRKAFIQFFSALAGDKQLVIKIDDLQWLDYSSANAILDLVIELNALIILSTRPLTEEKKEELSFLLHSLEPTELALGELDRKAVGELLEFHVGSPTRENTIEQLHKLSDGNPFYLEQIIDHLQDLQAFTVEDGSICLKDIDLDFKNSLQNVLLSRIDRLDLPLREAIKYASVLGQEFEEKVFAEMVSMNGVAYDFQPEALNSIVTEGLQSRIWKRLENNRLVFTHALLRDAAYDMQLTRDLKTKHLCAATAIEQVYENQLNKKYFDLLYHYKKAGSQKQLKNYLLLSADYSRKNFRSRDALRFYDQFLDTEPTVYEQLKVHYHKNSIYELLGEWDHAMNEVLRAGYIAKEQNLPLHVGISKKLLGQCYTLTGSYEEAQIELEEALEILISLDDHRGIMESLDALGNLYFRQSKYPEASDYFERALSYHTEEKPNYTTIGRMGLTYMNLGQHKKGIQIIEKYLKRKDPGKLHECIMSVNLGIIQLEYGDFQGAEYNFHNGLHLSQLLGNRLFESISYGSLGSIEIVKSDIPTAQNYIERDLQLTLDLGDKQGQSIAFGLMGELCNLKQEEELALEYFDRQERLAQELHYSKGIVKAHTGRYYSWLYQGRHQKIEYEFKSFDQSVLGINQASVDYFIPVLLSRLILKEPDLALEVLQILTSYSQQLNTTIARFYVDWFGKFMENQNKERSKIPIMLENPIYSSKAYISLHNKLSHVLEN